MSFRNRMWIGAAAGAAASGVWGDSDTDVQQRIGAGAVLGAAAGAITDWRAVRDTAGAVSSFAWRGAKAYGRNLGSNYSALRKAGMPMWKSTAAFGRLPLLMGAGAAIGAAMDSDDHKRGALIGAGVGVAARLAITGPSVYRGLMRARQLGPLKVTAKPILAMGLSAMAFAAGSYLQSRQVTAEATYNPVTDYDEAAPGSGVRERMNAMNANGSLVFGAHARRRG